MTNVSGPAIPKEILPVATEAVIIRVMIAPFLEEVITAEVAMVGVVAAVEAEVLVTAAIEVEDFEEETRTEEDTRETKEITTRMVRGQRWKLEIG